MRLTEDQIVAEIKRLEKYGKDYDTVRQSSDTCLGVGAHDAARAYDVAAIRLHGEFARLNFPEDPGPAAEHNGSYFIGCPNCGANPQMVDGTAEDAVMRCRCGWFGFLSECWEQPQEAA